MTKTVEQKALRFIDENLLINKGDRILIALSGGADSVFLLHLLVKYKKRFGISVSAFHLNHQLRGKSAEADEKFCTDFCKKNYVKLVRVSQDVKSYAMRMKLSIEEAGREIRYSELRKVAKKIDCNKIATAHNASDNAETVLMNFIKGSGINGLSGIPVRRENIIRPILCLTSNEIRDYLRKNKIKFRVDESNFDSDYERNFLRNEIIPQLQKKLNPKVEEKINNTSKIISEISSFIENQVEKVSRNAVKDDGKNLHIKLQSISAADKSFLSILFKIVIENKFNIDLSFKNLRDITELINSQSGRSIQLKNNIIATKERNEFIIGERPVKNRTNSSVIKIETGQEISFEKKLISIKKVSRKMIKFTSDKSFEFISGDELKDKFEVRRWKDGDKFHPIGMKGTKKISDFLSDEKIPSSEKKDKLVLTNGRKIVWVIGYRIDDRFKVTNNTKKILQLSLIENAVN